MSTRYRLVLSSRMASGTAALKLLSAALIALMAVYLFTEFRYDFMSDEAIRSVLARLARKEHELVLSNWVYANGDIFLATPYLFNVLVDGFMPDAFLANALSSFAGYVISLACFYAFYRSVDWEFVGVPWFGTAFLASGVSAAYLVFSIAEGMYSLYSAFAVLALIPVTRGKVALPVFALAFSAALVLGLSNPKRVVILFIAPLVLAWIISLISTPRRERRDTAWALSRRVLVPLAGCLVGCVIYYGAIAPAIMNTDAAASIGMSSLAEMLHAAMRLPGAWLQYLQPQMQARDNTYIGSCAAFMAYLVAGALIACPIISLRGMRNPSAGKRFMLVFGLCCLVVGAAAMIVSRSLFPTFMEIRYLTIAIVCFVPFTVELLGKYARRLGVLVAVCWLCSIYLLVIASMWAFPASAVTNKEQYRQDADLIEMLKSRNVCVALAPYWTSYVNTVRSNFSIQFLPVEFDGQVRLEQHHSYRGSAYGPCGNFALVVPESKMTPAMERALRTQFGPATDRLTLGRMTSLVYNHDIYQPLLQNGSKLAPEQLAVELSAVNLRGCAEPAGCTYKIVVKNVGSASLASTGTFPVRLGVHGLDAESHIVVFDAARVDFAAPVPPGSAETVTLALLPLAGVSNLQLCVMQENVAWYCDRTFEMSSGDMPSDATAAPPGPSR